MHFVRAKSILSPQNGMNLYRGCSHGCIYCDSRSLCYHIDHAFEDIEVKENAPELLERALRAKRKRCMIGTGSMCDPYLHAEAELGLTRRCLEIVERYGFGAAVLTKSDLVLRDLDLLSAIHAKAKAVVQMTLTTYDEGLCRILEPNVCSTGARHAALCRFRDAGIPTVVWLSPVLPYLTDTEENLRGILGLCLDAGVKGVLCFGMGLTLRDGDREYFYAALDKHFPGLKQRYIRTFGSAYDCASPNAEKLWRIFDETLEKYGVLHTPEECFRFLRTLPETAVQQSLFDPSLL
ncbi:MAG: radical SAM protein [Clostridia bacterium]|nr:radical SAM protein [Clostridia bacterium]